MKTYQTWEDMLYSDDEIHALCTESGNFNDDINKNHKVREDSKGFLDFMDDAIDIFVAENKSIMSRFL